MKSLLTARRPVFEFSIFFVVVLIGWAEVQLFKSVKPQIIDTQNELQGQQLLVKRLEQHARELQQNLHQTTNEFRQTVNGLQQMVNAFQVESNETRNLLAELESVFQEELEERRKVK